MTKTLSERQRWLKVILTKEAYCKWAPQQNANPQARTPKRHWCTSPPECPSSSAASCPGTPCRTYRYTIISSKLEQTAVTPKAIRRKHRVLLDRLVEVPDAVDDVEQAPPVLLDPLQSLLLPDHRTGRAASLRAGAQPALTKPRRRPHHSSYHPSPVETLAPRDWNDRNRNTSHGGWCPTQGR